MCSDLNTRTEVLTKDLLNSRDTNSSTNQLDKGDVFLGTVSDVENLLNGPNQLIELMPAEVLKRGPMENSMKVDSIN